MQKKSKVSRRTLLLILSGLVTTASIGVAVPFVIKSFNGTTSLITNGNVQAPIDSTSSTPIYNGLYDNFVNNYDGTLTSSSLVFAAPNAKTSPSLLGRSTSTFTNDLVLDNEMNVIDNASQQLQQHGYDPKYNSIKKVTDIDGEVRAIVTTNCFENNRKYMPILTYNDDTYYSYSQTRSWEDVNGNVYPGWTLQKSQLSSYDGNNFFGISWYSYKPTETLKKAYPNVVDHVVGLGIILPEIVKSYGEKTKDVLSKLINDHSEISYLTFYGVDDSNIGHLPTIGENTNIKKMAIRGTYSNLTGFAFPKSLLELEFSSQNYKAVDPLQLPKSAAIIYEQNYSSYFTSINLSSHQNMTNDQLQEAVNVVYQQRIHERTFQGNFAGGYIYSWNLRKTGLSSFNGVTIPMLTDGTGRFYIAHVEVETDGNQGPNKDEVIGNNPSGKPSNDSQIDEWYDWNEQGWSKVTQVTVTSKDNAPVNFENTVQEILGFVKKYPNIKTVDVSALKFTDESKTLDQLEKTVNEELAKKYADMSGKPTIQLKFIKEKKTA